MKPSLVLSCLAVFALQVHAAPTGGELRQVLQQVPAANPAPLPPRHLSPVERAELRRQLADFSRAPARRP